MTRIEKLEVAIRKEYQEEGRGLLFHGLHHVLFVYKKALYMGGLIGADLEIVAAAALTHDLNYILFQNSEPSDGTDYRMDILEEAGFTEEERARIEQVIQESHLANRSPGDVPSKEVIALSDADMMFKAMPITPIVFAGRYLQENDVDLKSLADKIVTEQEKLMQEGVYFYTPEARQAYMAWAETNLQLWRNVQESLRDPDIADVLKDAAVYTDA